jgi:predicted nucleic acid-binding Zn ribbon protein
VPARDPGRAGPPAAGRAHAGRAHADRAAADRARLAVEALTQAKADARARGDLPADLQRRPDPRWPGKSDDPERSGVPVIGQDDVPDRGPRPGPASGTGGFAPARGRPRREDPQPLISAIGGLLDAHGWQQRAAMGSVFGRWADIVGQDVAAHTRPDSFADGELAVTADSTAWATQVRLLAPVLVRRLNDELGDGSVRRVKVRGPAPPRQRGGWRVPGSKGPGDTYG